jgi:hypothetical protein
MGDDIGVFAQRGDGCVANHKKIVYALLVFFALQLTKKSPQGLYVLECNTFVSIIY